MLLKWLFLKQKSGFGGLPWPTDCSLKAKILKTSTTKLWPVSSSYNYFRSSCIVLPVRVKFVKKFSNNSTDHLFVLIANFSNSLYATFIFHSIGLKVVKLPTETSDSRKSGLGNRGVCVVLMSSWPQRISSTGGTIYFENLGRVYQFRPLICFIQIKLLLVQFNELVQLWNSEIQAQMESNGIKKLVS